MAFLNNLAKGFVRSAVNQVGRDGGKVISNQVYGNAHSTPIRVVSNNQSQTQNMDSSNLIEEKEYVWVKFIWAIIISGLLPILGGFIIIYRGFVNYNRKLAKMYKSESQSVYASDKRYNSGHRYEGTRQVKIPVKVELNDKQKQRTKIKSYGYFIIGSISIIIYLFVLR
ncbi:MAG: hypothetical protein ACI7YS_15285 [Flavobacterium sp.]